MTSADQKARVDCIPEGHCYFQVTRALIPPGTLKYPVGINSGMGIKNFS